MTIPLIAAFGQTVFMLLLGFVAIFLILLVLVQRGRGGGLAGALGGMGGSSAFGAKAGDVFTKVTVVAATLWIVLCIAATKMTPSAESLLDTKVSGPLATETETTAVGAPAGTIEESAEESAGESTSAAGASSEAIAPTDSTADSTGEATERVAEEAE